LEQKNNENREENNNNKLQDSYHTKKKVNKKIKNNFNDFKFEFEANVCRNFNFKARHYGITNHKNNEEEKNPTNILNIS